MEINRCVKESFSVIGKEGSTMDGSGFIQRLWEDANSHFQEIEYLAKRDGNGAICGIWGAMSDLSHSFKPWEDNFTKGLYLAGVEAKDGEEAPEGWTVWRIPGYEYGLELSGAVHDFICPEENGQGYMFFPIRRL